MGRNPKCTEEIEIPLYNYYCRFHGYCVYKGHSKIRCRKERIKTCKLYDKLERSIRPVYGNEGEDI